MYTYLFALSQERVYTPGKDNLMPYRYVRSTSILYTGKGVL